MPKETLRACVLCVLSIAAGSARAAKIQEFPIPTSGSEPLGIVSGPDGRLWFCEYVGDKVGAITTQGAITEFPIRTGAGCNGIVSSAGLLWYSEETAGKLGSMTTTGSTVDAGALSSPQGVADDFDGRIWAAESGGAAMYAFHARSNAAASKSVPLPAGRQPLAATLGPDAYVWVTEYLTPSLAKCSPGLESCVEVALPGFLSSIGVTTGPDGNLWFTDSVAGQIGRLTMHGLFAGSLTAFPVGDAKSSPQTIVAGPDGALWFTDYGTHAIGRITTDGAITEYPTPTPLSVPYGIAIGPDGNVWFTEAATNRIGRLQVHVPGDANGDGLVDVLDVFSLINFLFAAGPAPR